MDTTGLLLVYGALFIGVLLTFEALYHILYGSRLRARNAVNRRLAMLERGASHQEVLRRLRRDRRAEGGLIAHFSLLKRLDTMVAQSGATITTARLLTWMALITIGLTGVLNVLGMELIEALGLGVIVGGVLPVAYVSMLRRRRLMRFGAQLPDALDLIVRSLRSGQPLAAAIAVVAQEMADPIGSEFGIVEDEANYGLSLPDSIENMAERVGHDDMHYFVVAIRIQYGTGGNLAEVLSGLSRVIRDRFNMLNKIQAVSAEGRLSAVMLSAMPLVVFGAIMLLNSDYYLSVYDDPLFWPFIYFTLGLMALNLFVMRKLVNFKV